MSCLVDGWFEALQVARRGGGRAGLEVRFLISSGMSSSYSAFWTSIKVWPDRTRRARPLTPCCLTGFHGGSQGSSVPHLSLGLKELGAQNKNEYVRMYRTNVSLFVLYSSTTFLTSAEFTMETVQLRHKGQLSSKEPTGHVDNLILTN